MYTKEKEGKKGRSGKKEGKLDSSRTGRLQAEPREKGTRKEKNAPGGEVRQAREKRFIDREEDGDAGKER